MSLSLIVTTSRNPTPEMSLRAEAVAHLCGGQVVPRARGIQTLLGRYGADLCYVITREREALHDATHSLFVHPGLFYLKVADGPEHPLIRAVAPEGAQAPTSLIDGTLGLGGDALHIAAILKIPIIGVEAQPLLMSLAVSALERLGESPRRFAEPARQIHPTLGLTEEFLASQADDSHDVVFLDPMFETPLPAQPGFELLRRIAHGAPLTPGLVEQAARVAKRRVVIKVPGEGPPPIDDPPAPGFNRWVRGQALDYYIIEKELPPSPCSSSH